MVFLGVKYYAVQVLAAVPPGEPRFCQVDWFFAARAENKRVGVAGLEFGDLESAEHGASYRRVVTLRAHHVFPAVFGQEVPAVDLFERLGNRVVIAAVRGGIARDRRVIRGRVGLGLGLTSRLCPGCRRVPDLGVGLRLGHGWPPGSGAGQSADRAGHTGHREQGAKAGSAPSERGPLRLEPLAAGVLVAA